MRAQNPDNFMLYSLARAVILQETEQREISINHLGIRVVTSEVDFQLTHQKQQQVLIDVRMAPATAFSSPEILNRLLIAIVSDLAEKAGIQLADPRSKYKAKKKEANTKESLL